LIDVGDKTYSLREREMRNEERVYFLTFILRPVCKGKHEILGRNDKWVYFSNRVIRIRKSRGQTQMQVTSTLFKDVIIPSVLL